MNGHDQNEYARALARRVRYWIGAGIISAVIMAAIATVVIAAVTGGGK